MILEIGEKNILLVDARQPKQEKQGAGGKLLTLLWFSHSSLMPILQTECRRQ